MVDNNQNEGDDGAEGAAEKPEESVETGAENEQAEASASAEVTEEADIRAESESSVQVTDEAEVHATSSVTEKMPSTDDVTDVAESGDADADEEPQDATGPLVVTEELPPVSVAARAPDPALIDAWPVEKDHGSAVRMLTQESEDVDLSFDDEVPKGGKLNVFLIVMILAVAIGGITPDNAPSLIEAGADFLAVISAVWDHEHGPDNALKAFNKVLTETSA